MVKILDKVLDKVTNQWQRLFDGADYNPYKYDRIDTSKYPRVWFKTKLSRPLTK